MPMSDDPTVRDRFEAALDLHQEGVEGDEEAVIAAQEILEELLAENPKDARVRAFLGNLYTLRARDAIFYRKSSWLKRGLATLDEAVEMAPDDPHVRSVRAVNSYRLPRIFRRREVAEEDFAVLLDWKKNDPGKYSDSLLRFVTYHAGQFYEDVNQDKALSLYKEALEIPADSVSDEQILIAIQEIE